MKLNKWILLGIATLNTPLVAGASCYDPCSPCEALNPCAPCDVLDPCAPCDLTDGLTLYADWIYWKTRRGDLDYAISSDFIDLNGDGERGVVHGVCPPWVAGFRLGALKEKECFNFGFEYTWYKFKTHDNAEGPLWSTRNQGSPLPYLSATGEYKLDLNIVELTIGGNVCFNECVSGRVFTGFKYASIIQRLQTFLENDFPATPPPMIGTLDRTSVKSNMNAYGITFGINPVYKVLDCLDVFGTFSVDAYAADTEYSLKYKDVIFTGDAPFFFDIVEGVLKNRKDCWDLIGTLNLSFGLSYLLENPCGGGEFVISVGYEFHEWINTPSFMAISPIFAEGPGSEVVGLQVDRHSTDLGFDGVFVRVATTF